MNILLTITGYPPSIGGAQLHTHHLAKHLGNENNIQVISLWNSNRYDWLLGTTMQASEICNDYRIEGIPVHQIGISKLEKSSIFPWVLLYYPLMKKSIQEISKILIKHIEPYSVGINVIHNVRMGREPISYASYHMARDKKIPFVFTPLHHPRWTGRRYRPFHQLYRNSDAIIALTPSERDLMISLGVDKNKIYVNGNGPVLAEKPDKYQFRERFDLGDAPIVLHLGQKYAYKGIEELIASASTVWQEFPDVHFVFIGPQTNYSKRIFKGINDPRIIEIGNVELQEKTNALATCSILCVPSSQESFGGVFLEAWSFEKPVIGCKIPAVMDVISDSEDGFLVEQVPEAIAEKICWFFRNESEIARFGKSGNKKVTNKYSWEIISKKTELVYKSIT